MNYPEPIKRLLDLFGKLPGVGPKTAERFVFWLLKQPNDFIKEFAAALAGSTSVNKFCATCFTISPVSPCAICRDTRRDNGTICVVEDVADLFAVEQSGEYHGKYHVLGGLIAPLDNMTPEKLNIAALLTRAQNPEVKEIILALNPTMEGETTLLYLAKVLKSLGRDLRVTALGRGLPYGADLEYADSLTLSHALSGRKELTKT